MVAADEKQSFQFATTFQATPGQQIPVLPLVEYTVAAHRNGLGLVSLGYLPAVPGEALSEEEARKAISYIHLTVTERTCDQLALLLSELRTHLADAKGARN